MKESNYRIPLFAVITGFFWFSLYAYVPTLSPYAESLGASYKMIGIIVGSYGFSQMLIRIPLGIISDRLNRRKPFIIIGLGLALISAAGFWYFRSVELLLVFRTLSGMAAATWVTFTVLFSSYFKGDEAPKAIGYINSYNKAGQMAAMILGGIAAERFGAQAPFMVAVVGAVIALILSPGIVEKRQIDHQPIKLSELFTVAKDRELLVVSLLAVIFQLITFATIFGFIPVVARDLGASSFQLGLLTTIATLPGILASAMSGAFFASRFGERKTLIGGFLIIALSCIVVPYLSSLNLLYLSQIIGGFGRGLVFPLLMGLSIKSVSEKKRATAMGFFQAIYGLGMFMGPVLLGILSDTVGLVWGFWVIGLIGGLGMILTGIFVKNQRRTVSVE